MVFSVSAQSSEQCRLIRQAIVDTAFSQVGNYERTNKNDGKINKYALKSGGKYGDAYCSWGLLYCHRQNGVKLKKVNGKAFSWSIPKNSIIREYGKIIQDVPVRQGDIALSFNGSNWHVEIVTNYNTGTNKFYTVGFNTWGIFDAKQRRQGVWIHIRDKRNVIICNQLQFFWHEKNTVNLIANQLLQLQSSRLSESR
jgi:hypothetical protein